MRYLLFAGNRYHPGGGMDDFIKSSNDLEELRSLMIPDFERDEIFDGSLYINMYNDPERGNKTSYWKYNDNDFEWWHIYDTENNSLVHLAGTVHSLPDKTRSYNDFDKSDINLKNTVYEKYAYKDNL